MKARVISGSDTQVRDLLSGARTIAIVGASVNPERDSHAIMRYLVEAGYEIFPVNPSYREVLGKRCYPSVTDIGRGIDIVDVFRRSEAVPAVVGDAIAAGARTLWLQLGVRHPAAEETAEQAGMNVVVNRCIAIEHQRLFR